MPVWNLLQDQDLIIAWGVALIVGELLVIAFGVVYLRFHERKDLLSARTSLSDACLAIGHSRTRSL